MLVESTKTVENYGGFKYAKAILTSKSHEELKTAIKAVKFLSDKESYSFADELMKLCLRNYR